VKVGVLRQRSVQLSPQELLAGAIHDQQSPVSKMLDAHRKRLNTSYDFTPSGSIEPQDFMRAPVRDPQRAVAQRGDSPNNNPSAKMRTRLPFE
jgi:hypothetical protein